MDKVFQVESALQFCPMCGKELETNPINRNKACFLHGDFIVREMPVTTHGVKVTFEITPWVFNKTA